MKNRAFIFDMDGVIINSEQAWLLYGNTFLSELLGEKIASKVGDTIGMTVNEVYDIAVKEGFSMDKQKYFGLYDKQAAYIYSRATITPDIDKLAERLVVLGFQLGLVTSSRTTWIKNVLPRLTFKDHIQYIVSINDRSDLKPKPNPDGYLETIGKLGASPPTTVILEDSNSGIKAAKATGAYTIGFKQNLVPGYVQQGANIYANNIKDVIEIVEKLSSGSRF